MLGISNTAVTPPSTAAREPVSKIFLVGQAGLAEMDLAVDHAGQDVQAAAIDALARARRAKIADLGDFAVDDADVALAHAVLVDDGRVGENAVEDARPSAVSFLARRLDRPN